MDDLAAEKRALRRRMRRHPPVAPEESAAVRARVGEWLEGRRPATVLVYLAMPGEIDLEPLTWELPRHRWATTRTPEEGWLTVHPIDAPRERHRYGFSQPVAEAPVLDPGEVDLVLTPGVAFDRTGGRLGHGAGYYDQLLSRMRDEVVPVGITLERLLVDEVPVGPDDVAMAWIATERRVSKPGHNG